MKSKTKTKYFASVVVYNIKKFDCGLCKQQISRKLKINNIIYDLFEITLPETYLIMESNFPKEKSENSIYVINMENLGNVIKIVKLLLN